VNQKWYQGLFEGRSNAFLALFVIGIIVISGISGALIGYLVGQIGADNEPSYDALDIELESEPFANYTEYETNYTLNAPQYEVEPDLSNIINLESFSYLSEEARSAIAENYFVAIPSGGRMFADMYQLNYDYEYPSFVTSDSVLHAYHVLFDVALKRIEEAHFMNHIGNLSRHMVDVSLNQYRQLSDEMWKTCAKKNAAFFSVAAKLHDPDWAVPAVVEEWVDDVIAQINAAQGFNRAWFMEQELDFTQFTPRGHYTRTETLKRFFKTMIWLARVAFRLEPSDDWLPIQQNREKGKRETAQAILMTMAFEQPSSLFVDQTTPMKLWQEIYETTSFFVSTSDDLTPEDYLSIVEEVYDNENNLTELCNMEKLGIFIATAKECRSPRIVSGWLWEGVSINATKGLRFMGQRFVPDSYLFSQLTHDEVPYRTLPKGLDVMAVLDSNRAWELLDDEKTYTNYIQQINMLKEEYGNLNLSQWTQSLYWAWLYSFETLLKEPAEGHPSFMLNTPWLDKQLTTCLGTWTELRHDTILYVKQSYSRIYGSTHPPPGYVEPVPEFYAKLASLCKMMIDGLVRRGLILDEIFDKLGRLHSLLREFQTISEKELSGVPLNATEWETLRNIGDVLADIEGTYDEGGRAALIADVHTDTNNKVVLEEATGNPMAIYVAVPTEEGEVFLARGAMFSHYEFAWPMDDRLTDEAWQELLDSDDAPEMAGWMGSFVLGLGDSSVHYDQKSQRVLDPAHVTLPVAVGQNAAMAYRQLFALVEICFYHEKRI
jgi:hypothetical protein